MDTKTTFTDEAACKAAFKWIAPGLKPGINQEELVGAYKSWTQNSDYEKDLAGIGYQGHLLTIQYFTEDFPEEKRAEARVCDVGAGTGMVARGLREQGFRHIDAIDVSEDMLEFARKEGLYENYFVEYLTENELPIPPDTYDGVTAAGCFAASGVHGEALHELIRIVKPGKIIPMGDGSVGMMRVSMLSTLGGIIVMVTRLEYVENYPEFKYTLEPLMNKLEREGKWKKLKRDVGARFYADKEAVCYKFQVLSKSS